MQYSVSHVHVATTALLLSQNGNSEHVIFWGSLPPDPPSLACLCMHTYKLEIQVTPLLTLLATGLVVLLFCLEVLLLLGHRSVKAQLETAVFLTNEIGTAFLD